MLLRLKTSRETFRCLDFAFMTLTIAKREDVNLEILLFCDSCRSSRIDAATQKNDCFWLACHLIGSGNLGPFHWITFFIPADDTFIEDFHISITVFVENAISQTGQVMRACSIKNDRPVAWDAFQITFKLC